MLDSYANRRRLILVAREYSKNDVLQVLWDRVNRSSQKQVADELGIHPATLNDVLYERRNLTDRIARGLGFTLEVVYRKVA